MVPFLSSSINEKNFNCIITNDILLWPYNWEISYISNEKYISYIFVPIGFTL